MLAGRTQSPRVNFRNDFGFEVCDGLRLSLERQGLFNAEPPRQNADPMGFSWAGFLAENEQFGIAKFSADSEEFSYVALIHPFG